MKKMIFATLLLSSMVAANAAHALHCPPIESLSHERTGAHWVLDKKYTDDGWYVSSYPHADFSQETHIAPKAFGNVNMSVISNENINNDRWFVTCKYYMTPDSAFPRNVVVAWNQLLPLGPHPKLPTTFQEEPPYQKVPSVFTCVTSGNNIGYCKL